MAFSAAPHRLFFWSGAVYALATMGVWVIHQASVYSSGLTPWAWPVPAGAAHGYMMLYGVMGFFFWGFLATTFPRWLSQPSIQPNAFRPAWFGMTLGSHLVWVGMLLGTWAVVLGVVLMLAGQGRLWLACAAAVWRAEPGAQRRYPALLLVPLALGLVGMALYAGALLTRSVDLALSVRWIGLYGFVLPVVLAVTWRMVPFFTSTVASNYELRRGVVALPLLVLLCLVRGGLGWLTVTGRWHAELTVGVVDAALAAVLLAELLRWRPWKAPAIPLLMVLYVGMSWMVLGFALGAVEHLSVAVGWSAYPRFHLAALHAITVGGFGTLLLGIGTRVSLGHSGRGLHTERRHNALFLAYQAVPVARVLPDLLGSWFPAWAPQGYWSGLGWVAAFAWWLWLFDRILRSPRSDGRPG